MLVLASTIVVGLDRALTPATVNNVSFLLVHLLVLGVGVAPALRRSRVDRAVDASRPERRAAA
jgi:hypothetical protein